MRVALVHDQLLEFGGAERVLLALSEMYPQAPIYTAYCNKSAGAYERFKGRKIISSWAQKIPFFHKLASPLRFLAPLIWESFDFTGYDLVISSASWFITKGIIVPTNTLHVSYIHTPPRYLYGYETSVDFRKNFFTRLYADLINPFLRKYDFLAAQRPDILIANSENTKKRIKKFYQRGAVVIYPPVGLPTLKRSDLAARPDLKRRYFLIVSRLVGGKGLKMAVQACSELNLPLKIVGQSAGWGREYQNLKNIAKKNIEFLGAVSDRDLVKLYAGARAFLAVARDEDFGITPVEAMLGGAPVIAYRGGGYTETIIDGKTGIFFDDYSVAGLKAGIEKFEIQKAKFKAAAIQRQAGKFSKKRFVADLHECINALINTDK